VKIAQCVEDFVARKRVCGYEYDSSARILRRFAAFVGKIDIALVSEEHINLFLTRGHLAHHIWRSYRSLIRRFLAYWFARRQITRIPEPEQKPNIGTRFFPYVYSKAEIARLLAAAPICQVRRRCAIGSSTLSTIVLFLYGTGLRVTEALSLSDSNIDFHNGSIEICPGSLYRHRTIPIGSETTRYTGGAPPSMPNVLYAPVAVTAMDLGFNINEGTGYVKGRIAALADELDLAEFLDRETGKLSSGQRTRVALAKALLNEPEVLLLDEPTASLDPDTADWVRARLERYRERRNATILLASHNMLEVERLCERVIIMKRGEIVDDDAPAALLARYGRESLEQVFLDVARGQGEAREAAQ